MKILCWNVNGIRTLKSYHPWSSMSDFKSVLDALDADIICFQETKIQRNKLEKQHALVDGYDAFFSFSRTRASYSGVVTYVKKGAYTPIASEEGFTGLLNTEDNKEPLYFSEFTTPELQALDNEGRCVITDHGQFVLFNVYFPNEGPENPDRGTFKMQFHRAIQQRIEQFWKQGKDEGRSREVIVVGDVNVAHREIDHVDPAGSIKERGMKSYGDTPGRQWFEEFVYPKGPMIDTFRFLHPTFEGAYTCFNTLLNCRPLNYGTRIDYVLVTPGLLPLLNNSWIERDLFGSDHIPIGATFRDGKDQRTGKHLAELTSAKQIGLYAKWYKEELDKWWNGDAKTMIDTRDALKEDGEKEEKEETEIQIVLRDPPKPCCSRYWDEYSGKQQKISSWFTKSSAPTAAPPPSVPALPVVQDDNPSDELTPIPPPKTFTTKSSSSSTTTTTSSKPKSTKSTKSSTSKSKPQASGSILQFVTKKPAEPPIPEPQPQPPIEPKLPAHSSPEKLRTDWKSIFTPNPIPLCHHQEPAKEFTVNKPGPNKGRRFYVCARGGPSVNHFASNGNGGDNNNNGSTSAENVDESVATNNEESSSTSGNTPAIGEARCNFFQWKSSLKRSKSEPDTSSGALNKKFRS